MFCFITNNRLLIREMRFEIMVHGCRTPECDRGESDRDDADSKESGGGTTRRLVSVPA